MDELSEYLYVNERGTLCFNEPQIKEELNVIAMAENCFGLYFYVELKK